MNTDWEGKYGWEVIDVGKTDCSSQLQPGDLLVREGDGPRHHIQLIKEVEANGVGVRSRKEGDIGQMSLGDFIKKIKEEIDNYTNSL